MNVFDSKAATWDTDPVKVARAAAVADEIRKNVPLTPAVNAMEFGSGTGLLSFFLQCDLGHVTLVDSSKGMLEVAAQKIAAGGIENMRTLRLDLDTDPLPTQRFDLIYSLMTVHHVPDTARLLTDLHTLLQPGGHLCVADLDAEDGSFHGDGFSGHNGFDRQHLGELAEQAGFQAVSFSTVFRMTREKDCHKREYPIFLMVCSKT
ncbi:MAG: class I SAM-dependent methyltransferase [Rhodocyclaceae bacterium]|nr:class I SAM-dependent methyltransferase [Rhodocyclaceae bacterium]MCP5311209.1 class I SAM-dependent methyltransferase [Zoogloeaceae bacterium]